MTKDEHNAAAVHLLEAMTRGGGMSDRIRRLLESLVAPDEPDGPNVGALFAFADAGNARALLTLFSGWQRHGIPDALDRWRMERAEIAAEREAARQVADEREAAGDVVRYRPDIWAEEERGAWQ